MERASAWWRGASLLVLVAVGVMLVVSARLAAGTDLRAERRTQLSDLISAEDGRVADVTSEVQQLQDQFGALSTTVEVRDDPKEAAAAAKVEHAAGMSEVVGPGLTVTLDDAPIPSSGIPEEFGPDDYVVHQSDMQSVVNALWAGGADALAVMDQRIISTSALRCVGNTLILKGRVYAPPYTVTAVGPTERMERALDVAPGVVVYRQYAALIGLGYDVQSSEVLTIPAYEGPLSLSYAEPSE